MERGGAVLGLLPACAAGGMRSSRLGAAAAAR